MENPQSDGWPIVTLRNGAQGSLGHYLESFRVINALVENCPTQADQLRRLTAIGKSEVEASDISRELYGVLRSIDYPVVFHPDEEHDGYRFLQEFWDVASNCFSSDDSTILRPPVADEYGQEWQRHMTVQGAVEPPSGYASQMKEMLRRISSGRSNERS